jgi:DNA-binding NarL/FixJ family response regulator
MPEASRRRLGILVVDDHRAVAESIAMAIDLQPDMHCVGIAGTIGEARGVVLNGAPDVMLTDVRLPDGDGLEAASTFLHLRPQLRIVVLTGYADMQVLGRAALIGAHGILPKESGISAVLTALRRAGAGEMSVDKAVLDGLLDRMRPGPAALGANRVNLTEREGEVLGLLSEGRDPQTIALHLGISLHTCRGHVKSILAKLEAHSQLEAVVKARRLGIVPDRS